MNYPYKAHCCWHFQYSCNMKKTLRSITDYQGNERKNNKNTKYH